jgi:ribosomal protein L35AE/L33A
MLILQIEHEVLNFEGWKKAFESDPVDRKKAGVRGYKVYQRMDNPNFVIINLEFEHQEEAENTLVMLRKLWKKVEGKIIMDPKIHILTLAASKVL